MTGRDHLVLHGFGGIAEMARQALFIAFDQIPGVVHAERDGLLVVPVAGRVGTQPVRGGAVTAFATDSVANVERLRLLVVGNHEAVACEASCGRSRLDTEVAPNSFSNVAGQCGERAGVLILDRPSAVFILQDEAVRAGLNAAMATERTTRSRTGVPD